MKTLGFIYGVILQALENNISAEKALDLIRVALEIEGADHARKA